MKFSEIRKVFSRYTPIDIYEQGNLVYGNDVLKHVPAAFDEREVEYGTIIDNRIEVIIC